MLGVLKMSIDECIEWCARLEDMFPNRGSFKLLSVKRKNDAKRIEAFLHHMIKESDRHVEPEHALFCEPYDYYHQTNCRVAIVATDIHGVPILLPSYRDPRHRADVQYLMVLDAAMITLARDKSQARIVGNFRAPFFKGSSNANGLMSLIWEEARQLWTHEPLAHVLISVGPVLCPPPRKRGSHRFWPRSVTLGIVGPKEVPFDPESAEPLRVFEFKPEMDSDQAFNIQKATASADQYLRDIWWKVKEAARCLHEGPEKPTDLSPAPSSEFIAGARILPGSRSDQNLEVPGLIEISDIAERPRSAQPESTSPLPEASTSHSGGVFSIK